MSTTVTYKGSTIATVDNNTKTLTTAGKYLEANVILTDITGGSNNSGYTRTVIAPQQTVTPNSDRQAVLSNVSGGFVDASHYIVTIDGTEWYGTCETLWGNNLTVGEVQWFWTTPVDYVYPFGAIYMASDGLTVAFPDTNQHTIKIEKLELTGSGGGSSSWETVYSGTVTVDYDAGNGYYYGWVIPWTEPIELNSVWKVTWNGVPYECTATWEGSPDGNPYAIGNATFDGGQGGNNEPFLLQLYYGTHLIVLAETSGSYTVNIQKQVSGSSGGIVTKVIFPEQSVTATTADSSGYTARIDSISEYLQDDTHYVVTMDSVRYLCYANRIQGSTDVYAGDVEVIWGNSANAIYPFMIATWGNGHTDWGVADNLSHTVKIERVVSFDEATLITKTITQNGTYSAEDDSADGYSEVIVNVAPPITWETELETTVTITTYEGQRVITFNGYNEPFSANETYRVTWGDNQYICDTIVDPVDFTQDGYYIGNASIFGSQYEDTGESFILYRTSSVRLIGVTNDMTNSTIYLKIEKQMAISATLITKSIIANGTYSASDDSADGYSEVTVNVQPNLQSKSATPTTSSQTVSPDNGYDGLSSVTVGAIPSQYIVPTGNKAITENGTNIDVAQYATVSVNVPTGGGSSMNTQTAQTTSRRNNTSLGSVISLTCSKAGTYDVYWSCARSNTSQTWGSRLYINGVAYGTENTTWSNNVQTNHLTDVSLSANDTVAVYGRSRSGYYIYVPQLTIVQTA